MRSIHNKEKLLKFMTRKGLNLMSALLAGVIDGDKYIANKLSRHRVALHIAQSPLDYSALTQLISD